MTDRPDVFVSYRHRTPHATWVRDVLVPSLRTDGYSVVLDVDTFAGGNPLVPEMERGAEARVTVAIVDETYQVGGFVQVERRMSSQLIAVLRDPVDRMAVPPATATVDLVGNDDPAPVLDAVREAVRRVFVLVAEEDEEWVAGVLMPTLDSSGISAEHSGDLAPAEFRTDAFMARLLRADRVVIVLSSAYLRDVHPETDMLVAHVEAERNLDIPLGLPLQREPGIDLPLRFRMYLIIDASRAELWDAALAQVCRAVGVERAPIGRPPPCPYPGMRPFASGQEDVFFGRDGEIEAVISGLRRQRFVAVIGPSASGKSSLALAGVVPRLRQHGLDGGEGWHVESMRVGPEPVAELGLATGRWRAAPGGRPLLLVVDQLEELYAPAVADPREFEDALAALLDDPDIHVVVTVRADFYPNLMSGHLWPLVNKCRVEVVPLTGDGLREAIRAPARARRVVVAEALVERLAAETEGQPGLLPFLQETLVTLWGALDHRLLTLEAYTSSGDRAGTSGVQQAIRRVAEDAVGEIEAGHPGSERLVRNILVSLVQFGEGRPDTRRQVPVADLAGAAPDQATFDPVFATLVERRLVTVDQGADGTLVADLSHEAIIRGWPTLARWIEEDQAAEAARRRLHAEAEEWRERETGGHPDVGLLQSLDLEDARRWLAAADDEGRGVEPLIRRYVDASAAAENRRRRRRRRAVIGTFVVLVLVAGVLAVATVTARQAQRDAEQASTERLALQLRASAAEMGDERLPLRALLVRAADRLDPTPVSLVEMLAAVERARPVTARLEPPEGAGYDALWADEELVVAGSGDGKVTVWSMAGAEPDRASARRFDIGRTPLAMARRAGTDLLAVGGGDGSAEQGGFPGSDGAAYLVDLATATPERLAPERLALDGESPVSALAFAGDTLLVGRWDGTVAVVNASVPGAPVRTVLAVPAPAAVPPACAAPAVTADGKVRALAVDASGRWLAAGTNNCLVAVWDLQALAQPPQVLTGHAGKVRTLAFVPGTTTLLSSGDDRSIRRWDVGAATGPSTVLAGSADERRIITLCVAPDGRSVITAGRDHRVRRWTYDGTTLTLDPQGYSAHSQTVRSVACITPRTFASLSTDGLVLWDLDRPARTGAPAAIGPGAAAGVAVRPGASADVAVAASDQEGLVIVQRPGGRQDTIDLDTTFPLAVAYSPDGNYLAVAGDLPTVAGGLAGVAIVYDADSLRELSRLGGSGVASMRAVAVRDPANYAAGADDGTVRLRAGGAEDAVTVDSELAVRSVAYTADGDLLVGDGVGTLTCYDPARLERPAGRTTVGRAISGIAAGADGTVVAGTADGLVAVFTSEAGAACRPAEWTRTDLAAASDAVTSVALAAGDELAIVGTADEVELWDLARRRQVGALTVGSGDAAAFGASEPGASTLVAASGGAVDVYRLDRDDLRAALCELARRELNEDEQAAFLPDPGTRDSGRCR